MKKIAVIIGCLSLMLTLFASATVYKGRDAQGNIKYSDEPFKGAQKTRLPQNSIARPSKQQQKALKPLQPLMSEQMSEQTPVHPEAAPYTVFAIESPHEQQTFQNQPQILVSFNIQPELHEQDKIQVYLDGVAFGAAQSGNTISLNNVNRGQHTIEAKIIDAQGNVVKTSNSVTIFVHRASIGFNRSMHKLAVKPLPIDPLAVISKLISTIAL